MTLEEETVELSQIRLEDLMDDILAALARDVPWLLGADITAYRRDTPVVFASYGVGQAVQDVQRSRRTGPTSEAAVTNGPVTSDDLWNDRRWQELDLAEACVLHPEHARVLRKVRARPPFPGCRTTPASSSSPRTSVTPRPRRHWTS
ncbi:hypothetical protein GCM10029964_059970 [Kibdelosporangium lantanae]